MKPVITKESYIAWCEERRLEKIQRKKENIEMMKRNLSVANDKV